MEYNAEYLQGLTWYAHDVDGRIAAFNLGAIPAKAYALASHWEHVDDVIRGLPTSTECQLVIRKEDYWTGARPATKLSPVSMEAITNLMWPGVEKNASALPQRGIYQFSGERSPDAVIPSKYRIVGVPRRPISIGSLSEESVVTIRQLYIPLRFCDATEIDVLAVLGAR